MNQIKKTLYLFLILCKTNTIYPQQWYDVGGGSNNEVYAFGEYKGKLIVSGGTTFGGIPINIVASWDGLEWDSLGSGCCKLMGLWEVNDYEIFNSELFAAGYFAEMGDVSGANGVASWDGIKWKSVGVSSLNSSIEAIVSYNNELYAGGNFTEIGGLNVNRIARYNGTNWSSVGGGITGGFERIDAIVKFKNKLYVAGDFTNAGGKIALNIASWDGTNWSDLDTGLSYFVNSMTVDTNRNLLYVTGAFNYAGSSINSNSIFVNGIVSWDGSKWIDFDSAASWNGNIYTSVMYHNELYVGGEMRDPNDVNSSIYIAKWNGINWEKVIGPNAPVMSMYSFRDTLFVGGLFYYVNGFSVRYIAKYYSPPDTTIVSNKVPKKNETQYHFEVLPNPVENIALFTYTIPENSKAEIKIFDLSGREIIQYKIEDGTHQKEISLQGFHSGVYVCVLFLNNGEKVFYKKMVVGR